MAKNRIIIVERGGCVEGTHIKWRYSPKGE